MIMKSMEKILMRLFDGVESIYGEWHFIWGGEFGNFQYLRI